MLRASVEFAKGSVNLSAVTDRSVDSGVADGDILLNFADRICGPDEAAMDDARAALRESLGIGALVQASAIAANFSMNDRAANAMGIPMESFFLDDSQDFRQALGIDNFPSARNTLSR